MKFHALTIPSSATRESLFTMLLGWLEKVNAKYGYEEKHAGKNHWECHRNE